MNDTLWVLVCLISNKVPYDRCEAESIGFTLRRLRWHLFGHVLRLNVDTPAQIAMDKFRITTVIIIMSKNLEDEPRQLYMLFFFMNIMCINKV